MHHLKMTEHQNNGVKMQDLKMTDHVPGGENDGPSKSPGVKMQDLKMTDQITGHENARHENTGPEIPEIVF